MTTTDAAATAGGLTTAGLVAFLFGTSRLEQLPGAALVELLGELGVGTSAARTVIARLRTNGSLVAVRDGRRALYSLAGTMAAAFERIRAGARPGEWDGVFHGVLFNVPETSRSFRDGLRRTARHIGYAPLRAGLLIHPYDRWTALAGPATDPPPGATVYPVQLRFSPAHARTIANEAWELPRRATAYRHTITKLGANLATTPADIGGADALRLLVACMSRPMLMLLADPRLPPPLLPPDWPLDELAHTIETAEHLLLPAAHAYVVEVVRHCLG